MYATSTHVQNGHNPPSYSNHYPNGAHSPNNVTNGHQVQPAAPQQQQPQRAQPPAISKEPIVVVGIPSVSIQDNRLVVGTSQTTSTRSYTPLKVLGDGSFGTVWLCDWHGTLPPNTPLSPMQCGAGARPEWAGKRLVAVKRMKRRWEGGWDECQKLKELESLRAIPFHPNIIPLYDFFLLPATKELYFVFESMEGNLYHLIKTRKGRPFAGGLVSSIFHQIVSGLRHIHASGYFHRDMKPENVLVTTIGRHNYISLSPHTPPNTIEGDVVAIIKLADFGLARETKSAPPYTEYVSTRWYRAPEVLLLSRDYSNPVDMWALGTIMAELVNLRPLFPGADQIDQIGKIGDVLGDPSDEYGFDSHNGLLGGGAWPRGLKMAKSVGFQFPKFKPRDIHSLFDANVPLSLVHCIRDLLRYDPDRRLTSRQCLEHPYLRETLPVNDIPIPPGLRNATTLGAFANGASRPAHSAYQASQSSFPDASTSHRSIFHPNANPAPASQHMHATWDISTNGASQHYPASQAVDYPMEDAQLERATNHYAPSPAAMDTQSSAGHPNFIAQSSGSSSLRESTNSNGTGNRFGKLGGWSFGKKHGKLGFGGILGGEKVQLPTLEEVPVSNSGLAHKRSQSSGSRSLRENSPSRDPSIQSNVDLKKLNKKEAERLQREAEKQRRKYAERMQREQARAVMQKRSLAAQKNPGNDLEWIGGPNDQRLDFVEHPKGKVASSAGPIRQNQNNLPNASGSTTINAASGRFGDSLSGDRDWRSMNERFTKMRRRDFEDDHSISSSDVHSIGRMSSISFATVDSDPGPSRLRTRSSLFGMNRMTSMSSLRTSFDDFSPSARSSNSLSLEGQLAHDFNLRASMDQSHLGSVSPPPMQALSLSPSISPSLSHSPPWIHVQQPNDMITPPSQPSPYITVPIIHQNGAYGYDGAGQLINPYSTPASHGTTPKSSHSNINPIFKVSLPPQTGSSISSHNTLPPFAQLDAVAGGECPPLSPMSFVTTPDDP